MALVANRKFVLEAVTRFNHLTPDELAEFLKAVPTRNLAVLRDAVREFGKQGVVLPQDRHDGGDAVTSEIDRRWAE